MVNVTSLFLFTLHSLRSIFFNFLSQTSFQSSTKIKALGGLRSYLLSLENNIFQYAHTGQRNSIALGKFIILCLSKTRIYLLLGAFGPSWPMEEWLMH